ncbi:hypothetical protein TL16_g11918 [Triparma laevis f. inornata]|uniref:Uncharacterized protein n=1 Tax=Triparma laevis f. inornata TaxID=1714386 RepID=A0A9W7EUV8_9STRA|nr:hypothetical protein TL16_g11918 [Triparma laevis f. inornata]
MAHTISDLRSHLSPPLSTHTDHFLKCLLLLTSSTTLSPKAASKIITAKYKELAKLLRTKRETIDDELPPDVEEAFFGENGDEYEIKITSETLGLTVENVLERTVVRTVIPNQSAYLAGAKVGSVVSRVGSRSTCNCTHFETIDELRQSVRPLTLTLKNIPPPSLTTGRTLMSSLIDSSNTTTSTVASVSQRMCEILVMAVIAFKEAKEEEKVLGVGKVLKEYIKRCGGHGEEKISDSVNYNCTGDPESVEVSINNLNLSSTERATHDYQSTDDLGAAGNLMKVVVRSGCLAGGGWGNRFVSFVHGLSGSKSALSRKVGVSLCPILWTFSTFPYRLQLRGIITRSLHDIDQTVRRSTNRVLQEIVESRHRETPWLVLMCERAMTDPVGELRGNAVSLVCALCERCQETEEVLPQDRTSQDASSKLFEDIYLLQCKLLPIATRLAEDKSANVRLAVASHADRLVGALGGHWIVVLNDLFMALLKDEDEKVRTEAVYTVPRLVHQVFLTTSVDMQSEVLTSVFMSMTKMVNDTSTSVRVSLATSAGQMLVLITKPDKSPEGEDERNSISSSDGAAGTGNGGVAATSPKGKRSMMNMMTGRANKESTPVSNNPHLHYVDENILPVVQRLLHDTDPSVCSNALRAVANASHDINSKKADSAEVDFVPVLKEKQVLRLLPTLTHLSTNEKWRVRRSAVEVVPALVKSTTGMKSRAEIGNLAVSLLTDPVAEVRKSAGYALCVASSLKKKKDDWLDLVVVPHLQSTMVKSDHRQRLIAVFMLRTLINKHRDEKLYLKDPSHIVKFYTLTLSMSKDALANVRLNVGKTFAETAWKTTLEEINSEEGNKVKSEIKRELKTMIGDKDADVRYFSRVASGEI